MLQKIDSRDWRHYIPHGDAKETRNVYLELEAVSGLDLEILSANPVIVNLITSDGETMFVRQGSHINVKLKVTGFSAVEIVAQGLFSYRNTVKGRWYEKVDPTPLSIAADQPSQQPFIDAVQAEVARYMARHAISEELRSEISVAELLDDIQNGDDEFEQDVDEWGLPPIEMQPQQPQDDDSAPAPQEPEAPEAPAAAASSSTPKPGDTPA